MKVSLNLYITILLLLSATGLKAQSSKLLTNEQLSEHVSNDLNRYYKPDEETISHLCRRGVMFVRFRVNQNGNISDIGFSRDSAAVIQTALQHAVDSLQHDPDLIYYLKKTGKVVVQPFIYDYQLGCNLPKHSLTSTTAEENSYNASYYQVRDNMEHYGETLFDMLNFEGKKLSVIDCLLLNPIRVGATSE